jgi:hypothetical protein
MEGRFIYCFNEDEFERLLKMGFVFICECKHLGGHKAYVFENHQARTILFEEQDFKQIMVTDQMYF